MPRILRSVAQLMVLVGFPGSVVRTNDPAAAPHAGDRRATIVGRTPGPPLPRASRSYSQLKGDRRHLTDRTRAETSLSFSTPA